jgi:hypothetical protein
MKAQGDPSRQMVESHWEMALHSFTLGDIIDSRLLVGSRCIIYSPDRASHMFPTSVDHLREMLSVLTNLDESLGGMVCCWI